MWKIPITLISTELIGGIRLHGSPIRAGKFTLMPKIGHLAMKSKKELAGKENLAIWGQLSIRGKKVRKSLQSGKKGGGRMGERVLCSDEPGSADRAPNQNFTKK